MYFSQFQDENFGVDADRERFSCKLTTLKKTLLESDKSSGTFNRLWNNANNLEEFKQACFEDDSFNMTKAAGLLFKEDEKYVRKIVEDNSFITISALGGVKVGNFDFCILIENGNNSNLTNVAVVNKSQINIHAFDFVTNLKGTFHIFDSSHNIAKTLTGIYGVFANSGHVVFEKWE